MQEAWPRRPSGKHGSREGLRAICLTRCCCWERLGRLPARECRYTASPPPRPRQSALTTGVAGPCGECDPQIEASCHRRRRRPCCWLHPACAVHAGASGWTGRATRCHTRCSSQENRRSTPPGGPCLLPHSTWCRALAWPWPSHAQPATSVMPLPELCVLLQEEPYLGGPGARGSTAHVRERCTGGCAA